MAVDYPLSAFFTKSQQEQDVYKSFFALTLVRRELLEDGAGRFFLKEVRVDAHGERLSLTYLLSLDGFHRGD